MSPPASGRKKTAKKTTKKTAKKAATRTRPSRSDIADQLRFDIDSAWERRTMLTVDEVEGSTRPTVERVIDGIEKGEFRVAEPDGKGGWQVNEWLKKAVLL